eukprot:2675047-Prymnesium_polylepis.1
MAHLLGLIARVLAEMVAAVADHELAAVLGLLLARGRREHDRDELVGARVAVEHDAVQPRVVLAVLGVLLPELVDI